MLTTETSGAAGAGAGGIEFELEVGPHAAGELGVLSFEADEAISTPFRLAVTLAPPEGLEVDPARLLGTAACLHLRLGDGETRYLHGLVAGVRCWEAAGQADRRVRLRVVPTLATLRQTRRCRVFQELTVPEIVDRILGDAGVERRASLSGSYAPRRFCVQYDESDLDFVHRLLEEEGIFYFFEHAPDRHTLVLGDSPGAYGRLPGGERIPFREPAGAVAAMERIEAFSRRLEVRADKVSLRDFDYLRPDLDLTSSAGAGGGRLEIYAYPGGYTENAAGARRAALRLEAERAQAEGAGGSSVSRRLVPGHVFELAEHPLAGLDGQYLLLSVRHRGQQAEVAGHVLPGDPAAGEERYRNDFTCLRKEVPFRPPRRTRRPVIAGPQTAIVTGPAGEEIHTDEHGRVKVQFHWDREGEKDDRSSCWIRVSQAWAGPGFGAVYLPRVGQEVVVEFLEGDPDRPLVSGAVYNGVNPPPLQLPAEKTRSTLRTASSPGGEGFNELRFEDASGQEEIYLHAQRNMDVVVEHDRAERVGASDRLVVQADRTSEIGGNRSVQVELDDTSRVNGSQYLEVAGDRTTTVGGGHTETVSGDQAMTVGGASSLSVGRTASETVGLAKTLNVGGAYLVTVGGAMNEAVGGVRTEEVGGAKVEVVGAKRSEVVVGSRSVRIGGDLTEKVGKGRTLKVGKDLTVNVGGKLSQQAGKTYVLKAKEIVLSAESSFSARIGSSTIEVKRGGQITIDGAKIQLSAKGALVLKGAPVSEN